MKLGFEPRGKKIEIELSQVSWAPISFVARTFLPEDYNRKK